MTNEMTCRERNLILSGLKSLDKIRYLGKDMDGSLYHCNICDANLHRGKILLHFVRDHSGDL